MSSDERDERQKDKGESEKKESRDIFSLFGPEVKTTPARRPRTRTASPRSRNPSAPPQKSRFGRTYITLIRSQKTSDLLFMISFRPCCQVMVSLKDFLNILFCKPGHLIEIYFPAGELLRLMRPSPTRLTRLRLAEPGWRWRTGGRNSSSSTC